MRSSLRQLSPMTRRLFVSISGVILICCLTQAIAETQTTSLPKKDEEVKQIVLGIMSYTRWVPPPIPVQLCIVGSTKHASLLEHIDSNDAPNKIIVSKQNDLAPALSTQCDVIYFGDVPPNEQQRIIAARQNHPILVLSENNPSCELGSSFCLNLETSPITFTVN
jgi:hypothetical protein